MQVNFKKIYGIRKQIDKYKANYKDRYQETLKYNNIEKERGEAQK